MSSQILISEPHPTIAAGTYTHSGRGGAGNTFRATSSSSSKTASAPRPARAPTSSRKFYSGIGGAGNIHKPEERAAMNLGEEFERAKHRDAAERTHVGVGGAGNVYRRHGASSESSGSLRSSADSTASTSHFWGRISSSSFGRHH
jgi:hypothetical protein